MIHGTIIETMATPWCQPLPQKCTCSSNTAQHVRPKVTHSCNTFGEKPALASPKPAFVKKTPRSRPHQSLRAPRGTSPNARRPDHPVRGLGCFTRARGTQGPRSRGERIGSAGAEKVLRGRGGAPEKRWKRARREVVGQEAHVEIWWHMVM